MTTKGDGEQQRIAWEVHRLCLRPENLARFRYHVVSWLRAEAEHYKRTGDNLTADELTRHYMDLATLHDAVCQPPYTPIFDVKAWVDGEYLEFWWDVEDMAAEQIRGETDATALLDIALEAVKLDLQRPTGDLEGQASKATGLRIERSADIRRIFNGWQRMYGALQLIVRELRSAEPSRRELGELAAEARAIFPGEISDHLPAGLLRSNADGALTSAAKIPTLLGRVERIARGEAALGDAADTTEAILDWIVGNVGPIYKDQWVALATGPETPNPAPTVDTARSCGPAMVETADEGSVVALTRNDILVIQTMGMFDASMLLSAKAIAAEMNPSERLSDRTIGDAVRRLIALNLAERPRGKRGGARLTVAGRRHLPKIAD